MTRRRVDPVVRFLSDPASYPHHPRKIGQVQTHSSHVFLAPPLVYLFKKPVDFGFLDFSTLEKRRRDCVREVVLNRRLSPDLYLGVVPIYERNGKCGWDREPGSRVAEYAVKMNYLEPRWFLDRLLRLDKVSRSDLDRVLEVLAPFYRRQTPTPDVTRGGSIARVKRATDDNFHHARPGIGKVISRTAYELLRQWTHRVFRDCRSLFKRRRDGDRIVDGHGDLHAEHIHLAPDRVTIFDCIEFNKRLRTVDVACDAAFLSMDLDAHGRPDLGRYFVGRLAEELEDPGMLALMDFYKAYRACVRGKVHLLQARMSRSDPSRVAEGHRRAADYFRLALQYAVAGSDPTVFALMGPVASGKSSLAERLSGELKWPVFSSDRARKAMAGIPAEVRTPREALPRVYSAAVTRKVYTSIAKSALEAVRNGGRPAIVDATFGKRAHRDEFRRRCERAGVQTVFIEVNAPDSVRRRRLIAREQKKGVVSDARSDRWEAFQASYQSPTDGEFTDGVRVDSTGSGRGTLRNLLSELSLRRIPDPDAGPSAGTGLHP